MWYKNISEFMTEVSGFYDEICKLPTVARRRFFTELQQNYGKINLLLDMSCSTGELCCELAQIGIIADGLDFSGGMIEVARKKAATKAGKSDFYTIEMKDVASIGKKYNVMYNNSLTWNPTREYACQTIQAAYENLDKGGLLIIDMLNYSNFINNYKPLCMSSKSNADAYIYKISRYVEYPRKDISEITLVQSYIYQDKKGQKEDIYSAVLKMRLYETKEMMDMLIECGFDIVEVYFDYKKNQNENDASTIQIIGKK